MVVGRHLNRHAIAPLVFLRINPRTALKRSAPFRSSTSRAIAFELPDHRSAHAAYCRNVDVAGFRCSQFEAHHHQLRWPREAGELSMDVVRIISDRIS